MESKHCDSIETNPGPFEREQTTFVIYHSNPLDKDKAFIGICGLANILKYTSTKVTKN